MVDIDRGQANQILDPMDFFGGQANRRAAELQSMLAQMGLQLERDLFGELRQDEAPVRDARNAALAELQRVNQGGQLPQDPSLQYQEQQAITDLNKMSAAQGKSLSGGNFLAQQDAVTQLRGRDTTNQLNRLLNLAGFQTTDLLGSNSLIAANTDAQANQMANINGIRNAANIGQSNAIFNVLGQGARYAGAVMPRN